MSAPLARLSVLAALVLALPGRGADDAVQFNRDIRPIMSDTCFHCHGFDEQHPAVVTIGNQGADGFVVIDAVNWQAR